VDLARPRVIEFPQFGDASTGILTVAALQRVMPFAVTRVFWTYGTPPDVTRGRHAHYRTETVLVAVSGRIVVSTELPGGELEEFTLDSPDRGVYLPPLCWRTMRYTDSAVQVAFESNDYINEDYIRSLDDFRAMGDPSVRERD
jgi:hypothetical protein